MICTGRGMYLPCTYTVCFAIFAVFCLHWCQAEFVSIEISDHCESTHLWIQHCGVQCIGESQILLFNMWFTVFGLRELTIVWTAVQFGPNFGWFWGQHRLQMDCLGSDHSGELQSQAKMTTLNADSQANVWTVWPEITRVNRQHSPLGLLVQSCTV